MTKEPTAEYAHVKVIPVAAPTLKHGESGPVVGRIVHTRLGRELQSECRHCGHTVRWFIDGCGPWRHVLDGLATCTHTDRTDDG